MKLDRRKADLLNAWLLGKASFDASKKISEKEINKAADKKALMLFREASKRVPAYKAFLKKNSVDRKKIKNIKDLRKVPCTTKENYIDKYTFKQRAWDGKFSGMHTISLSSGTMGHPHFWPRTLANEIEGAFVHEIIFRDIFDIRKKQTLVINGFAMGNWIAGTFTSACVNLVSWKNYPLTLVSPGYILEEVLDTLERLASQFEQIIIAGHIPFLKEIAEQIPKRKIRKKTKIKLLGTGQAITENWRDYVLGILGEKLDDNSVINLYGSADAALMGFENQLSIYIRRLLLKNREKIKEIFGAERLPSLYVFDPRSTYFQEENRELVITKDYGCPLIRYNIRDEGGVIYHKDLLSHFGKKELKELKVKARKFPFVYLFGRDKFMVKIFGANVYSEHVQASLMNKKICKEVTGRYKNEIFLNKDQDPEMVLRVELNPGISKTHALALKIREVFVKDIKDLNSEYKDVLTRVGEKAMPKVILYENGNEEFFPKGQIKKTA